MQQGSYIQVHNANCRCKRFEAVDQEAWGASQQVDSVCYILVVIGIQEGGQHISVARLPAHECTTAGTIQPYLERPLINHHP